MSTSGSFTRDLRRLAKRALVATLLAVLVCGTGAIAKAAASKSPVDVRAGNSWSQAIVDLVDGNSWS